MAKRKMPNEGESVESYLTNDFNLEIYESLTDGDNTGMFEPLEFFKLLYAQYEAVKASKSKPLTVVKKISQLKLTDEQRYCLLDYMSSLIYKENGSGDKSKDKQLGICATFIQKEIHKLEGKLFSDSKAESRLSEDRFDFDKMKLHLETLTDIKAKIKYLIEIKTEYQQQDVLTQIQGDWFDDKCDKEIKKLKKLMALDSSDKTQSEAQGQPVNHSPEHTTARQVLAIYFLLQYTKTDCPNTAKADFIAFLTNKSRERIRQFLSGLYKSKNENYTKWEKDMRYVRAHFEALGLTEIVKMIDNELNFES
jgi:hypothetical protein